MKQFIPMRSPYELCVGIAGMVTGGLMYIRTNLQLLDAAYITWEKVVGLLWGCLVALFTGFFAVAGKRLFEWFMKKYFKKK